MNMKLKKKKIVALSKDNKTIPANMTIEIAGGITIKPGKEPCTGCVSGCGIIPPEFTDM